MVGRSDVVATAVGVSGCAEDVNGKSVSRDENRELQKMKSSVKDSLWGFEDRVEAGGKVEEIGKSCMSAGSSTNAVIHVAE